MRPARAAAGGGVGVLVIAVIVMLLGGDPTRVLSQAGGIGGPALSSAPPVDPAQAAAQKEFVGVVLADTEEVWSREFQKRGRRYDPPGLVLFTGIVESACGQATSAVGPFYCPADQKIYLDTDFFEEMSNRFRAGGDFARAYVIAHEVGHHVQNLLGTSDRVERARRQGTEREANAMSVRLELQADFYAGVWAHHARSLAQIDREDIREALTAANAIGDDTLQRQSRGTVVPDSFTHGTSEQRMRWFTRGWESGRMEDGDTFRTNRL